jgi:homoserine O-acetyltransferase/O-succinyltransferase
LSVAILKADKALAWANFLLKNYKTKVLMNTFQHNNILETEQGGSLQGFTLAYHTFGKLNAQKDNVVWICHALTANSNPVEWWPGLVGEGFYFNPNEHFIVCANVLGSCYGSTGPLSVNSETQQPYYLYFPELTIRDMVQALILLRKELGLHKIKYLIGGSLGGQQAMEWAIAENNLVENLILLATNAHHSPWGVAFNETQRMALAADATWGEKTPNAAQNGLKAARALALLSYRNYHTYLATQSDDEAQNLGFQRAISYQQYQGEKLMKRFNAYSYYYLSKAMDSHHVGRNRGGVAKALATIQAKTLVIGISSDILFPVEEQKTLALHISGATYAEIESLYGHDGFLIETQKITEILTKTFDL